MSNQPNPRIHELLLKVYEEYADHSFECPVYDGMEEGLCTCGFSKLHAELQRLIGVEQDGRDANTDGDDTD